MLTYAVYSHKKENPILTTTTIGFGNNLASLLAAVAVIPTVFSYFSTQNFSSQNVLEVMKADNQGLTFIWIPNLFSNVPGGALFLSLFFLALSFAAFSSLISMLELDTRIIMDAGLSRRKAILIVGGMGFLLGLPSALSMSFFNNQDWAWSLGLMVSGFFFTIAVLKCGPKNFRQNVISIPAKSIKLGRWFDILPGFLLPIQFLAMLGWWFWQSYKQDPRHWFNIFSSSSIGTVLFQWLLVLGLFIFFNRYITKKLLKNRHDS